MEIQSVACGQSHILRLCDDDRRLRRGRQRRRQRRAVVIAPVELAQVGQQIVPIRFRQVLHQTVRLRGGEVVGCCHKNRVQRELTVHGQVGAHLDGVCSARRERCLCHMPAPAAHVPAEVRRLRQQREGLVHAVHTQQGVGVPILAQVAHGDARHATTAAVHVIKTHPRLLGCTRRVGDAHGVSAEHAAGEAAAALRRIELPPLQAADRAWCPRRRQKLSIRREQQGPSRIREHLRQRLRLAMMQIEMRGVQSVQRGHIHTAERAAEAPAAEQGLRADIGQNVPDDGTRRAVGEFAPAVAARAVLRLENRPPGQRGGRQRAAALPLRTARRVRVVQRCHIGRQCVQLRAEAGLSR